MPVCPVATKTERWPRSRAARSSSSTTLILPIAQSEPTRVHDAHVGPRWRARAGTSRSERRGAQVAQLHAACSRRARRSSGSSASTVCRPASTSSPRVDGLAAARARQAGVELAAGRRDADQQRRRAAAPAPRRPSPRSAPARASTARPRLACGRPGACRRPPTTSRVAKRSTPWAVLAWPSCEQALGEERERSRPRPRARTPRPGRVARHDAPVREAEARERRLASSRCPSRSTQSTSGASCAAAAMPSSDSIMQPSMTREVQRARGVDHAQRLAQAAGLGELDVEAVGVAWRSRATRGRSLQLSSSTIGGRAAQLAQRAVGVDVLAPGTAARSARRPSPPAPGISSRAVSSVQPSLASTRSGASVARALPAPARGRRARRP